MAALRRMAARRLVVKLGSRLLTGGGQELDRGRVSVYVDAVARHREVEVVLVSSGAVAAGYGRLGMSVPPVTLRERQAAAAVGQPRLMRMYAELFAAHGLEVGQVLLTQDGLADRRRYLDARAALGSLFAAGVVPVVNENDAVSVREIRIGDNDNLAAYTAALVEADALVLLTDVPGVYDREPSEPGARLIEASSTASELRPYCYRKRARESTGGMATKLEAAEKASAYGIPTVIASGLDAAAVECVFAGRPVGTRIAGSPAPLPARRHWMAVQPRVPGGLVVDDGALAALSRGGNSLLPRGVTGVVGRFQPGDVVSILDGRGVERARGVVAYDDREVARIKGRHSDEIEEILGYRATREVVRADRIVMLEERTWQ
jgi:glutamate 5-kinase